MKKLFHLMLIIAAAMTLSSCAMLGFREHLTAISRIEQGQTHEQVREIMKGEPVFRRFSEDGLEQWEYHRNQLLNGDYDVVLISFRDGHVVSMDSFPYVYPKAPQVDPQ